MWFDRTKKICVEKHSDATEQNNAIEQNDAIEQVVVEKKLYKSTSPLSGLSIDITLNLNSRVQNMLRTVANVLVVYKNKTGQNIDIPFETLLARTTVAVAEYNSKNITPKKRRLILDMWGRYDSFMYEHTLQDIFTSRQRINYFFDSHKNRYGFWYHVSPIHIQLPRLQKTKSYIKLLLHGMRYQNYINENVMMYFITKHTISGSIHNGICEKIHRIIYRTPANLYDNYKHEITAICPEFSQIPKALFTMMPQMICRLSYSTTLNHNAQYYIIRYKPENVCPVKIWLNPLLHYTLLHYTLLHYTSLDDNESLLSLENIMIIDKIINEILN